MAQDSENVFRAVKNQYNQLTISQSSSLVHKVLVYHIGGLSPPRKSVVRLTDHPDMTTDVYRGRKTT